TVSATCCALFHLSTVKCMAHLLPSRALRSTEDGRGADGDQLLFDVNVEPFRRGLTCMTEGSGHELERRAVDDGLGPECMPQPVRCGVRHDGVPVLHPAHLLTDRSPGPRPIAGVPDKP